MAASGAQMRDAVNQSCARMNARSVRPLSSHRHIYVGSPPFLQGFDKLFKMAAALSLSPRCLLPNRAFAVDRFHNNVYHNAAAQSSAKMRDRGACR